MKLGIDFYIVGSSKIHIPNVELKSDKNYDSDLSSIQTQQINDEKLRRSRGKMQN